MAERPTAERISTGQAARICGLSSKTLLKLARDGKVPGAAELDEGLWRFDVSRLRDWLRRQETQCQKDHPKISTRGAKSGGAEYRLTDEISGAAYEQVLGQRRASE
jgi:hypothetical protein